MATLDISEVLAARIAARPARAPAPGAVMDGSSAAAMYRLTEEQRCSATPSACSPTSRSRRAPPRSTAPPSSRRTSAQLLAAQDILALPFPEEHGGLGGDLLTVCLAVEQLSRACATTGLILAVQELGALPILLAGTDEQQARWFPELASGE